MVSWDKLLTYYLSCLKQQDGVSELLAPDGQGTRHVLIGGRAEPIFSAPELGLPVDASLREFVDRARTAGQSLFYGYPLASAMELREGRAQLRLGALLLMELTTVEEPDEKGHRALIPRYDEPFLHPALLSALGVKGEQQSQLAKELPPSQAMGSAQALGEYLRKLGAALNLATTRLNANRLDEADDLEFVGIGVHNAGILFRAESGGYTWRLVEELKQIRSKWDAANETAVARLLAQVPVAKDARSSQLLQISPIDSNDAQEAALKSALTEPLTVVTGPPGTGKSQLITNVLASAWASGESVLLVSTNNQAVDVACARAQAIAAGAVIRTGSKEHREKAKASLSELIADQGKHPDIEALKLAHRYVREESERLRDDLETRSWAEGRLAEVLLGQGPLAMATGWPGKDQQSRLSQPGAAEKVLAAVERVAVARLFRTWRMRRLGKRLEVDLFTKGAAVKAWLALEKEAQELKTRLRGRAPIEQVVRALAECEHKKRLIAVDILKATVSAGARGGRAPILAMMNAKTTYQANGVAAAFPAALKWLKGWASTTLSVGGTVPLTPGLFDLVVVDEASQCPIPHLLPMLFRAKRALIVGDAQQLAPIAQLPEKDERRLMEAVALDRTEMDDLRLTFSRWSIFDAMAKRCKSPRMLDEHYRSHPQIIELSNRLFYGGRLTVLTDPGRLIDFGSNAVAWRDVQGEACRPDHGSAINEAEAQAVAEEVAKLLQRPEPVTVGVVTPFSAQANRIQQLMERKTTPEQREQANLRIGTAHRFQGDERDVIVFSPVASMGIQARTLAWLSGTPNLFNVAITRARSYLLVVGNRSWCRGMVGVLGELARYVDEIEIASSVRKQGTLGGLHSEAERMLYEAMLRAGLKVNSKVVVKGYECDFVVDDGTMGINIECDGVHHTGANGRLRLQDRARDALIGHQGLKVVRVPAWRCLENADAVVAEVFGLGSSAPAA